MNLLPNSLIILSFVAFMQQCGGEDVPKGTPDCIHKMITLIAKDDVWNPPAKVYRYIYNGKTVYYIPQRCCDIPSQLFDENCQLICSPDGGFSGGGDGRCKDFFDTRTDEKLIWEDDRKP
ncbi:MAG TPA: hypothetical protein VFT90_12700 [Chryseosolibacter sp.]|nr:hypothetical protein [Chryseosolibacter sp.]